MPRQYLQHFIVRGKHLGVAVRDRIWVFAEQQAPRSLVFVCPVCGESWAKCPVEADPQGVATVQWEALLRCCPLHSRSRYDMPGTLTIDWDQDFNASFPEGVVRWEFQQHLAMYPAAEA